MLSGRLLFEGATMACNAVFEGGYYSKGPTIACNAVFQGGYYLRGLLNEGDVYLRKYSMWFFLAFTCNAQTGTIDRLSCANLRSQHCAIYLQSSDWDN